jgi:hypothetical protein
VDHGTYLSQVQFFVENPPEQQHHMRKYWRHVRFMTKDMLQRMTLWADDRKCYDLDKISVNLGIMSPKTFARSYKVFETSIVRPILRNPYKGLRNAAKDVPVAPTRKSSFEDAPNPRQRRDIDPKNLSPSVRARLYPDWQPKPRKSRVKPGIVD